MVWPVRVVRPILVKNGDGDGQTKRTQDVELTQCGRAYAWILGDIHTLARTSLILCNISEKNKIIPEEVDYVFLTCCTGIDGLAALFLLFQRGAVDTHPWRSGVM